MCFGRRYEYNKLFYKRSLPNRQKQKKHKQNGFLLVLTTTKGRSTAA